MTPLALAAAVVMAASSTKVFAEGGQHGAEDFSDKLAFRFIELLCS
jgi:hypothetical protein